MSDIPTPSDDERIGIQIDFVTHYIKTLNLKKEEIEIQIRQAQLEIKEWEVQLEHSEEGK